jgi:ribonuclease VapC
MILDSSAVISLLKNEDDAFEIASVMAHAPTMSISAATYLECVLASGGPLRAAKVDELLDAVHVVPFGPDQLPLARHAHATYGRASGSPARLNFGDCISYALAKSTGQPLLFKGDDFTHTDVTPALRRTP